MNFIFIRGLVFAYVSDAINVMVQINTAYLLEVKQNYMYFRHLS